MPTAIVTTTQAKQYLGETGSGNDTILSNFIDRITLMIEAMLDQPVMSTTIEEYLNGNGCNNLYLTSGRIRSLYGTLEADKLANLQYRTTVADSWTNIVPDMDYVYLDGRNDWCVQLLDGYSFPQGERNIRIKYTAGAGSRMLGEMENLCLEMLQMMWNESKQGGDMLGKISKNLSQTGMSTNLSLKDLNPEWQVVIDRWKRLPYE